MDILIEKYYLFMAIATVSVCVFVCVRLSCFGAVQDVVLWMALDLDLVCLECLFTHGCQHDV